MRTFSSYLKELVYFSITFFTKDNVVSKIWCLDLIIEFCTCRTNLFNYFDFHVSLKFPQIVLKYGRSETV